MITNNLSFGLDFTGGVPAPSEGDAYRAVHATSDGGSWYYPEYSPRVKWGDPDDPDYVSNLLPLVDEIQIEAAASGSPTLQRTIPIASVSGRVTEVGYTIVGRDDADNHYVRIGSLLVKMIDVLSPPPVELHPMSEVYPLLNTISDGPADKDFAFFDMHPTKPSIRLWLDSSSSTDILWSVRTWVQEIPFKAPV